MDKFKIEGLKQKLATVPGINGKEEYFNSAVLVLLMFMEEEYHFVFEKRAAFVRQPGEICFPGGKFDPAQDADFLETAIRETEEELGVDSDRLSIIGILDTIVSIMGTTVDAFLGVIDISSLNSLKINSDEVEKMFTIPVSYFEQTEPATYRVNSIIYPSYMNQDGEEIIILPAKELGLPERYTKPWGNVKSNVFVYKAEEGTIWGTTARLIRDVITKLKSV